MDLKHCPWCGEPARVSSTIAGNGFKIGYYIECRSIGYYCSTRTQTIIDDCPEKSKELAIDLWQNREMKIPYSVEIPSNHIILEKYYLEGKKFKLVVEVSRQRGICSEFKDRLNVLYEFGELMPLRFSLIFPLENLTVKLEKIDNNQFHFYGSRMFSNLEKKNKTDHAWLKRKPMKPPIFENLYNKILESG